MSLNFEQTESLLDDFVRLAKEVHQTQKDRAATLLAAVSPEIRAAFSPLINEMQKAQELMISQYENIAKSAVKSGEDLQSLLKNGRF